MAVDGDIRYIVIPFTSMKFFYISLAILVNSIAFSIQTKAQESLPSLPLLDSSQEVASMSKEAKLGWLGGISYPSDKAILPIPAAKRIKLLKQMEHGRWLCRQFLVSLRGKEVSDPVSLEASLVDLRSQCQSQYDRLLDQQAHLLPEKASKFYQIILEDFVPKAEFIIQGLWEEQVALAQDAPEEGLDNLLSILEIVEDHFTHYQHKYLHVDRSYVMSK